MIRNLCTCGAYAIRPYPDGRKELYLRSIFGLCETAWPSFWIEKWSCETDYPSIWIEKWLYETAQPFFLIRKRIIRNGIFGISVGAYCIRPLNASSKGTYDQKSRYMWGVFNTPLPWRQKRTISKINFGVMQNGMIFFLIWKMVMQNWLSFYMNRKRVMRDGTTLFLIWKMIMRNGRKGFWENVLERCFWGTYFRGYFSLSQNESTPDFRQKSGVQNGKSLFEEVYSSSPSRMDALSENKQ